MTETEKLLKAAIEKYEQDSDRDDAFEDLPVVNSIKNSVRDQKGPRATYLFLGPPATGKTFLAVLDNARRYETVPLSQLLQAKESIYEDAPDALLARQRSCRVFRDIQSGEY